MTYNATYMQLHSICEGQTLFLLFYETSISVIYHSVQHDEPSLHISPVVV
jgi:hypothetical protein